VDAEGRARDNRCGPLPRTRAGIDRDPAGRPTWEELRTRAFNSARETCSWAKIGSPTICQTAGGIEGTDRILKTT